MKQQCSKGMDAYRKKLANKKKALEDKARAEAKKANEAGMAEASNADKNANVAAK